MDGLYPIIRRVRRPLETTERPTAPAAVPGRSSASHLQEAVSKPAEIVHERPAPVVIGDSLKVIDRRVGNNERKEQHGGKTTKKA